MGVAVRGGLESLIHTTRQIVEEIQAQEEEGDDMMILRVDLVNAFNMVDRDEAFKEVAEHFPEMLSWVLSCYKNQAVLMFGSVVIYSESGFHQGDPLASLLFSLTLMPIIRIIVQRLPNICVNGWYLDDGGIIGRREELQEVVDIIWYTDQPSG